MRGLHARTPCPSAVPGTRAKPLQGSLAPGGSTLVRLHAVSMQPQHVFLACIPSMAFLAWIPSMSSWHVLGS